MNLIQLQKSLRAVEPAAVLVPPRVLQNIIKQHWNLSGFYWTVPHRDTFIIDRQTLFFGHVDQEDLALEPNELLPPTVMLLAWPGSEEIPPQECPALLLKYWQLVFHASVHLRLENQWNEGKLTPADLRSRIAEIGAAQFDEIKNVLVQDKCLPAAAGERLIYVEFAAHFLEEYYFASGLLDGTFPGLKDKEAIRKLLEQDVDGADLFKRTRLAGAAEPEVKTVSTSKEAHEFYYKLVGAGDRASQAGNVVLAAIQRQRAARVGPADLASKTLQQARADMHDIAGRLQKALGLDDEHTREWEHDLCTLLDKADQGSHPAEAAMLYDLEKVCLDNEQDIYALDLVEWLFSMGKRPIKRSLPSQRLIRLTRHLRSAKQRLTMARLSEHDRKHLGDLLQNAVHSCESRVREGFRPVFVQAFEDVGLKPSNAPEKVAFNKVIEELLDRVLVFGFLTFSDMRDTLSRNQLKLPDMTEGRDFVLGDALIRLDRRLATLLDGVYRRSEFYIRWLERFTALNFGTTVGRLLTLFVTLPFGVAFLLVEAGNLLSNYLVRLVRFYSSPATADQLTEIAVEKLGTLEFGSPPYLAIVSLIGLFMLGMIHWSKMRQNVWDGVAGSLQWLRLYFVKAPISILRASSLKNVGQSRSGQPLYWYVLKPLILSVILWLPISLLLRLYLHPPDLPWWGWWWGWLIMFGLLVATRPGLVMTNALSYSAVQFLEQIRAGLLPRLLNFVVGLFKNSVHFVEAMLFYVDEWLRFRKGENQANMLVKAILTVFWFPISYLVRFNLVVFIEPILNPLKIPVCSIAFKFWLPLYVYFQGQISDHGYLLWAVLSWLNFWCADAFGFVFWEVKENWSLYRSNRSPKLQAVSIGPHGETMAGLLQPGFHSGTVPKLYSYLREAERQAHATGNWSGVRTYQEELAHIAEAVRLSLVRDFVALLDQDPHWRRQGTLEHLIRVGVSPYAQGQVLNVGKVYLSTNQIRVELLHPRFEEEPVQLEFTNRSGWLLVGFTNVGWLRHLNDKQLRSLHNALVTLYKLAGIDLVREQLQAVLPPEAALGDLSPQGIYVRQDGRPTPAVIYDLATPAEIIAPRLLDGQPVDSWPSVGNRQILFQNVPVTWEECIRCWQSDVKPDGSARSELLLLAPDIELMPRGVGLAAAASNGPAPATGSNGNGHLTLPESNAKAGETP